MYIKLKYSQIEDVFTCLHKIRFAIFFLLVPITIFAQKPSFRNYTNADGLPSNEVYMVMQDRQGYIWMATNYGVCRYDGYNFETYTMKNGLTDNTVYELFEDYKGRIWFVTGNLMFSYFENNKIHPYKYNNIISKNIEWIPYIENRSFYVDSLENIYFGIFEKGIFVINKEGKIDKLKEPSFDKKYFAIEKISEKKYMLYRETPVSDSIYYNFNGLWHSLLNNEIGKLNHASSFVYYSTNNKLYFTQDKGIYIFTASGVDYYKMPDFIISLDEDNSGNIWVGLRSDGAMCYKDGDFNNPPFLHLLKGKPVSKIYSDNEGGFWFSTTTEGVFYTPSLTILNYTTDDGLLNNQIKNISKINKNQLSVCAESNEYNVITNNTISIVNEDILGDEKIEFVQKKFNREWIGTNRKLYIKENGIRKYILEYYKIPEAHKNIVFNPVSVFEIDPDTIYVSFVSMIWKIIKNKKTGYIPPYSLMRITNVCKGNNGEIFFGSKIGPGIIDSDTMKMLFDNFPELRVKTSYVMFNRDENSLWIATKGDGIIILKKDKLKKINVQNGLSSNYVKHLFKEGNQIWASTNAGVNLLFKENQQDTTYTIKRINSSMGLISNEVNMISFLNDKIYVATDKGLSFFNPSEINYENNINRPVVITKIQINERDTVIKKEYELPHDIATILISFRCFSYKNAGKHTFLYRLKGLSDQWQSTRSIDVRYTTLPPGNYQFEVRQISQENTPSENIQSILIIIHEPYWKTWWFIFSVISGTLLIIFLLFRYRMKTLSRQNKLKLQMVEFQAKALNSQINPHFIFNSLNSIQFYVLNNDIVKSNKYLSKFSRLMRSVLENSQETSISLDKEIKTLTNYIEIEQLRFNNKFDFEIKTELISDIQEIRIPTLLIQPYIENAIWHGFMNKDSKGFLSVILTETERTVNCTVEDNGVGRKRSAEINARKSGTHKSLGTKITQDRLDLLNKEFKNNLKVTITDLYDSSGSSDGTRIEIILPKMLK